MARNTCHVSFRLYVKDLMCGVLIVSVFLEGMSIGNPMTPRAIPKPVSARFSVQGALEFRVPALSAAHVAASPALVAP